MANFEIYHLFWKEYNFDDSILGNFTSNKDYGIYQVYGEHPVYGTNTLLYIGQTKKQTFSQRMKGRYDLDTAQVARFTKFYAGYLCKVDDITEANWEEAIDIVEKTLIIAHSPALNSQDVKGFLAKDTTNILIFNWGERGRLLPEVSTLRCSEFYHNSEKYNFENLALKL